MSTITVTNLQEHEIIKKGQFDQYNTVNLIIPNNIRVIDKSAFSGFPNLESVTFESGSTIEIIEAYAFSRCPRLKSIKLPNTLRYIGDYAFSDCEMLGMVQIEKYNQIEIIGKRAFYQVGKDFDCKCKLSSIILSSKFERLGECAFYECKIFNVVDFSKVLQLKEIPENTFYKAAIKKVIMPTSGCVKKIGKSAFSSSILSEIVIPASGIVSIEESAFWSTSLKDFDFRGVKHIGFNAFTGISDLHLKTATLPTDCQFECNSFSHDCQIFKKDLPLLEPYDSSSSDVESGGSIGDKLKGIFGRFKK